MNSKWLYRKFIEGPFLSLVTSEEEFHSACTWLQIPMERRGAWIKTPHSQATAHYMEHSNGDMAVIVAIKVEDQTSVQVAALLVHEAVHVFQEWCSRHGEESPSREFEAYSIQNISQSLMQEYYDRMQRPAKK